MVYMIRANGYIIISVIFHATTSKNMVKGWFIHLEFHELLSVSRCCQSFASNSFVLFTQAAESHVCYTEQYMRIKNVPKFLMSKINFNL